jgi:diguanylate cyclase (GGDEF)-like protein/PAS domain S-box-containing protein
MKIPLQHFCNWDSLRTRIAIGMLLAVVLSLWLSASFVSHFLRRDMEEAISAQQYSTVSLVAREVDRSLRERLNAVDGVARRIPVSSLGEPAVAQAILEQRVVASLLFNWGMMVVDRRGIAVASVPSNLGRVGVDYSDLPEVQQTLADGRSRIFEPMIGKRTGQPVLSMAVPLRDAQGRVQGLVFGITNLASPNFLDEIGASKYGKTGDFLITVPRSRLYVTSSDKRRVLKSGPPPGVNAVYDRYIGGYEGSGVARSSRGVVELSSSKRIAATGWLMQSVLPAEEAFAPIHDMQRRLMLISLLLSLVAGVIAWWWLRRQFGPLQEASALLGQMRDGELPRQSLPLRKNDEIGQLAKAFNGLLASIHAEEAKAAEHAANQRLRKIVAHVPGVVFQYRLHADGSGSFPFVSDAIHDIYGLTPQEMEHSAMRMREMLHPADAARFFASMASSAENLAPWRIEYRICLSDDRIKWVLVDAIPEKSDDGEITWFGFIADISESKAMEAELRIAATTFESQEGIVITDADSLIIRVNHAFTQVTGYSPEEVIGRTPTMLKSGRHDAAFYRHLWTVLKRDGYWRGEIWNRRKNGEVYAEWATITAVRDSEGKTSHYVAVFTDITEHKQIEEEVRRLAFYDPLTNLPNRRLFIDRMEQALNSTARNRSCGALLFLDLDQFKVLNDRHGHFMGDELLIEVARRLSLCVRASDTVARLGGDEFVVLLHDIGSAEAAAGSEAAARDEAQAVAEKIRATLAEPYVLQPSSEQLDQTPVRHRCTTSIGICIFSGNSENRDELLRRADVAMYEAKAAGRNTVRVFSAAPLVES